MKKDDYSFRRGCLFLKSAFSTDAHPFSLKDLTGNAQGLLTIVHGPERYLQDPLVDTGSNGYGQNEFLTH